MATAHADPAFAQHGIVSGRQGVDVIREPGGASGLRHFGVRRPGPADGDVLADGRVEDKRVLKDEPDLPAQRVERHIPEIVSVEAHLTLAGVEAQQQIHDRAFAAAGRAHERHIRARRDG